MKLVVHDNSTSYIHTLIPTSLIKVQCGNEIKKKKEIEMNRKSGASANF